MADTWQTIEQAAVSLGVSVRTVNRHMAAGKLPSRLNAEGRREVLVSAPDPVPQENARASEPSHAADGFDAVMPAATDAVTGTWNGTFTQSPAPAAGTPSVPPEPSIGMSAPSADAPPVSHAAGPSMSVDADMVLALADKAAQKAEMAVTAYQTLARVADVQVRESRRNARLAWAAAAVMAAGVTATVGWATRHVTRAAADVERLQNQVVADKDDLRALSDKQDTLRAERIAAEQSLRAELTEQHDKALAERANAEDTLRQALVAAREHAARAEGQLAAYREQDEARQTRETVAAAAAALSLDVAPEPSSVAGLEAILGSDSHGSDERVSPTTRQSAPRRKATAAAATTRPSVGVPESTSASTAEDR